MAWLDLFWRRRLTKDLNTLSVKIIFNCACSSANGCSAIWLKVHKQNVKYHNNKHWRIHHFVVVIDATVSIVKRIEFLNFVISRCCRRHLFWNLRRTRERTWERTDWNIRLFFNHENPWTKDYYFHSRALTGVDLIKLFWCKFTYSLWQARSFHKNAINTAYVHKMV